MEVVEEELQMGGVTEEDARDGWVRRRQLICCSDP